jgi:dolichol kinase
MNTLQQGKAISFSRSFFGSYGYISILLESIVDCPAICIGYSFGYLKLFVQTNKKQNKKKK